MTEKNIFVYKLFLSLNISDFSLFSFCKNCNTPLRKVTSSFPANPSQSWGPAKPPLPENFVGDSTLLQQKEAWANFVEFLFFSSNCPNVCLLIFYFTWPMYLSYLSSDYDHANTFWLIHSLYLCLPLNKLPPVFFLWINDLTYEGEKTQENPVNFLLLV